MGEEEWFECVGEEGVEGRLCTVTCRIVGVRRFLVVNSGAGMRLVEELSFHGIGVEERRLGG